MRVPIRSAYRRMARQKRGAHTPKSCGPTVSLSGGSEFCPSMTGKDKVEERRSRPAIEDLFAWILPRGGQSLSDVLKCDVSGAEEEHDFDRRHRDRETLRFC